jgi:penicillin amidase
MAHDMGKAPWAVTFGPSTRRIIDFAEPGKALGISPLGQSGVPFDEHYDDQAGLYAASMYGSMHLDTADIAAHTESTLTIKPSR